MSRHETAWILALSIPLFSAAQNQGSIDPRRMYQIAAFKVEGTRLPSDSVIRLSQLKVGQKVNYSIVDEACHRVTSTGLVKLIEYTYDQYTDQAGVTLTFKVQDELPLLPVKMYPPEDADSIWSCLEGADPIFTREMPNTRNALDFYTANINRCLANAHRPERARAHVACDIKGNAAEIVFNIR